MDNNSKELMLLEMLNDLSYAKGRIEACEHNINILLEMEGHFCRVAGSEPRTKTEPKGKGKVK